MRLLQPLYAALAKEFVIEMPACEDLEAKTKTSSEASLARARRWFAGMDSSIQVHQLRQFLQTSMLSTDEAVQALLEYHLQKTGRTDADRDKIDFLLVQYFSNCVPSRLDEVDVDLDYVSQVLGPVLGAVDLTLPAWIAPLEDVIQDARQAQSLHELLNTGALERGRKLKVEAGENYYVPAAMVAFTRSNFLMRRFFFRLMHRDLNAVLDGLRELERRGVNTIDCRTARFSSEEPTVRLRMVCQSWKVMFHAEYSSGQPVRMLVDLHTTVDAALAESGMNERPTPSRAKAVAAGAAEVEVPDSALASRTAKPERPPAGQDEDDWM